MTPVITTPDGAYEIISERGLRHKIFDLGGGKRRLITRLRPVHVPNSVKAWQDGNPLVWTDPNTSVELKDGFYQVKNAWYRLQVDTSGRFRYRVQSRRKGAGDISVELELLDGGTPTINISPIISENKITFQEVVPNLDLILICKMGRVELIKRLKNEISPRSFTWITSSTTGDLIRGRLVGCDNADGLDSERDTEYKAESEEEKNPQNRKRGLVLQRTTEPVGLVDGRNVTRITETWSGETYLINKATRIKSISSDVIYPVDIDPDITEPVASDANDGTELNNATWVTEDHYYYGDRFQPFYGRWPGWRFTAIALDQGVTIDIANLKVDCNKIGAASANFAGSYAYADDVDDAPAWSGTSRPSQITKTTAKTSVSTTFATTGLKTIDVTSIIQEIVNRAGWATGQNMRLTFQGGASERTAWIDDYGSTLNDEAVLEIDFTAGGGGGPTPTAGRRTLLGVGI